MKANLSMGRRRRHNFVTDLRYLLAIELRSPYRQPQIIVGSFTVTQRLIEQTDGFSFVFADHADTDTFRARFRAWPNSLPIPPLAIDVAFRTGRRGTVPARR